MALLPYRAEGKDFLLVQTGGLNGRLMLFVSSALESTNAPAPAVASFITNYLNVSVEEIPPVELQKSGRLYVLKPVMPKGKLNRVEAARQDNETVVSVLKDRFADSLPAQEPQPDKWFDWEMRKTLQAPFPNREDTR